MSRWLFACCVLLPIECASAENRLGSRAALEAFFDGAIGSQIAAGDGVGATVAVVEGDRIAFSKGYGQADRDRAIDVAADRTLFRIGSVTKVFVWIAVLQQHALGRLDLDADVNDYLADFEIPPTFPEPVTLRHLMTHTPGFADRIVGLFARGPRTLGEFHDNLIEMRPARVRMPGRHAAYSNYGAALAAHLVERVAGATWDDYLDAEILAPLGMTHTTGRQPVPKPLEDDVAAGYRWQHSEFIPSAFEYVRLPPAGSISATADDMAQILIELLSDGDGRVLPAASRAQLFARGFAGDARLNGIAHGLFESSSHGQPSYDHGGDTLLFHSVLRLYPAQRLGLFLSFNADRGALARDRVVAAFEDWLFGVPVPPRSTASSTPVARYVGAYRTLRVPVEGPSRLLALLSSFLVVADSEGRLHLPDPRRGVVTFVETDRGLFSSLDGRARIAFPANDAAVADVLYVDSLPFMGFERVPPRDHPLLQLGVVAGSLVILGLVVVWPFSALRRRGRTPVRGETSATLLAFAVAAVLLVFTVGLATTLAEANEAVFGLSPTFEKLLWIPVGILPVLLALLATTSRAWVQSYWWPARRIHYTLVTAAAWAYVAWLFYWQVVAIPIPIV